MGETKETSKEETTEETPAEETPHKDVFGAEIKDDGAEIEQPETKPEETEDEKTAREKKEKEEGEGKSEEVKTLESKLVEYGNNLKGQNTIIDGLEKEVEGLEKGGGKETEEEAPVLFKDIKTSKDLTAEERENMTASEITLFDRNASLETAMNTLAKTIFEQNKSNQETKEGIESGKVEDLNSSVKVEATKLAEEAFKADPKLAENAKELSDKIIVEFKEFNNKDITPQKLIELMKKALNNVTGYTPPKELEKKTTTAPPVKSGKGAGDDPHNVNHIVEGVNKKNEGNYEL